MGPVPGHPDRAFFKNPYFLSLLRMRRLGLSLLKLKVAGSTPVSRSSFR